MKPLRDKITGRYMKRPSVPLNEPFTTPVTAATGVPKAVPAAVSGKEKKPSKKFIVLICILLVIVLSISLIIIFWPYKYSVNFYIKNENGIWDTYQTVYVRKRKTIEKNKLQDPEQQNYTFNGWYTDQDLTVPYKNDKVYGKFDLYGSYVFSNYVAIPVNPANLTYNQSPQTPDIQESIYYTISVSAETQAGTYTAVLTLNDPENYRWSDGTTEEIQLPWVILKADRTNTLTMDGWKVGQTPKIPGVGAIAENAVVTYYYSVNASGPFTSTVKPSIYGTHYVRAEIAESANYNGMFSNIVPFFIAKADSVDAPALELLTLVYNGNLQIPALDETCYTILNYNESKKRDAGNNYEIILTLRSEENYEWWDGTSGPKTFTWSIQKAERTNNLTLNGWKYGTPANPSVGTTADGAGIVYYYDVSSTGNFTSTTKPLNAGTYYVKAVIAEGSNYKALTTGAVQFTIDKAVLTVNAVTGQGKTYGATDPEIYGYDITGWQSGEGVTLLTGALSRAAGENSGSYTINQGNLAVSGGNYTVNFTGVAFTIAAAKLTVTVNAGQSKEYGDANPVKYTYDVTGWQFSDETAMATILTGALERRTGENADIYAINIGSLRSNSNNYTIEFIGANFTVTQATLYVTALGGTKMYGDSDPVLKYDVTGWKTQSDDDNRGNILTGVLSRKAGENVGSYAIGTKDKFNEDTLRANVNYTISFTGADFKITPATLTVTPVAGQQKTFGSSEPEIPYSVTGWKLSDSTYSDIIGGALSRAQGESVGIYSIEIGTLDAGDNYIIVIASGAVFEITMAGKIAKPGNPAILVYNGGTQTPVILSHEGYTVSVTGKRDAGSYIAALTLKEGYSWTDDDTDVLELNWEITPAVLTVKAKTGQGKVYGENVGNEPALTYDATGWKGSDGETLLAGALSRAAGENAGSYTVYQGNLAVSGGNYSINFTGAEFTISKAVLTVKAKIGQGKVYGENVGNEPALTYDATGLKGSDGETLLTGALLRARGENVGKYIINQGDLNITGGNYTINFTGAEFTITKARLTITPAAGQTKVYGDDNPQYLFTAADDWKINDDEGLLTGALSREPGTAVGTYKFLIGTLSAGGNYELILANETFGITKESLTVTANALSKIYGQSDPVLTFTAAGWKLYDTVSLFQGALKREAGENVKGYTVDIGTLTAGGNYEIIFTGATFTITEATLTVKADIGQGKTYGEKVGSEPELTYDVTGWQRGDTISLIAGALSRKTGEDAGLYVIGLGTLNAGGNYKIDFISADFTITRATLRITVAQPQGAGMRTLTRAQTKIYGEKDPELVFYIVISDWKFSDGAELITGSLTRESGENVGLYKISLGSLSAGKNYSIDFSDFSDAYFAITPATLTITVNAGQKKTYGGDDPSEFTFTATGWKFNDEANRANILTGALSRATGENAGSYAIGQNSLDIADGNENYTIVFIGGFFNIDKAVLTVTVNGGQEKVYGGTNPAKYTFTAAGWQFDDEDDMANILTGALSRAAGENAGSYAIEQNSLAIAGGNYILDFNGANFTITKAVLTITVNGGQEKVYGGTNPVKYTFTAAGWQFDDEDDMATILTGALSRTSGENAGSYAINQGNLDAGNNYTITFIGANFTVNKAVLIITVTAGQKKTYGDTDPSAFTFTASGWKRGDDEKLLTGALTRAIGINVGTYEIMQGSLDVTGGNYTITFTAGTVFTVEKAVLTVTVTSGFTKVYGESDPELIYSVGGWKLGESATDRLTGKPSRAEGENAGDYPFNTGNLDAGNNYRFEVTAAQLTITKATLTVTADAMSKTYGGANPVAYTYDATGWKNGDEANKDTILTGALSRTAGEDAGIYAVGPGTLSAGGNYIIAFTGANFTINKESRTNTVTLSGWTYGTPNNPSISGTVAENAEVTYYYDTSASGLFNSRQQPADAGTYYVRAYIAETKNYKALTTAAVQFTISTADGISLPAAPAALTYTGVAQSPSITANANYTITLTAMKDAGTYTAVLSLKDTTNYKWFDGTTADKTLEWVINKAEIALPVITTSTFTYDGYQKSPVITTDSRYTITGNKEINAGGYQAKATILDTKNYQWKDAESGQETAVITFNWTINKAQVTVPQVKSADYVYNGTLRSPAIDANVNYTITGNKQTDAGDYYALITLVDTGNYEWKDAGSGQETAVLSLKWTIKKAQLTIPVVTSLNIVYDGSAKNPTIAANPNYTVSAESKTDAGTYQAIVSIINTQNYEWKDAENGQETADITLDWTIKKAQLSIPSVTSTNFVYDGSVKSPVIAVNNKYSITGNSQTNAGTHTATVIIVDKANYEWADGKTDDLALTWTIAKAKRTNTVTLAGWTYGQTPNDPDVGSRPDNATPVYTYYSDAACQNALAEKPSDAGTYYVRAYLPATTNYNELTTAAKMFTIAKEGSIARPGNPAALVYNKTEQLPVIDANPVYTVTYYSDAACEDEITGATDAGTYYAKIVLNSPANYDWDDGTYDDIIIAWIITRSQLGIPAASGATTFTYNAAAQTLAVSGFDSGTMEISDNTKTSTGDYTALISLKTANYEWTDGSTDQVGISWHIQKANRTNTVSLADWYVDAAVPNTPSAGIVEEETAVYYYATALAGPFTSQVQPSAAGTYYVRAYIAASTNYNELITAAVEFTILTPSYTITFVCNGGTQVSQITETYLYNVSQPSSPTMTGYTFVAWYKESGFTNKVGWPYSLTGDITFYAEWRVNILSVTYDYDGGTGTPASASVNYGSSLTLPTPVKKGFTFTGWTGGDLTSATGSHNSQNILSTLNGSDKNVTLKAQWSVNTITIIYNANEGSGTMTGSGPADYNSVSGITVKACTFTAPDEYLTFWRWNTRTDGTGTVVPLTLTMSELWDLAQSTDAYNNKILTLYAEWDTIFIMGGTAAGGQITGIKTGAAVPANLVIPETVTSKINSNTAYTVVSVGANAFKYKASIESVIIGVHITGIGLGAFSGCAGIIEITVPFVGESAAQNLFFGSIFGASNYLIQNNFVPASLKTVIILDGGIPDNAFYGCENIETVTMPDGLTAIGDYAFAGCAAMGRVTVPDTVSNLGAYAFKDCVSLGTVNLAVTCVTEIKDGAFSGCEKLVSVFLNNETSLIGDLAFSGCKLLNGLLIPDSVGRIGSYAFSGCAALSAMDLTSTAVTVIETGTFLNCKTLASIILPVAMGTSGLLEIEDGAFAGTTALISITIPDTVSAFGTELFKNGGLTSVTMPFTDAAYPGVFKGLKTELTVRFNNTAVTALSAGAFANFNGTETADLPKLVKITLPSNLTSIGASAFSGCGFLPSISVPQTVTVINNYAFQNCSILQTADFTGTSSLDQLNDGIFSGCSSLQTVVIPGSVTIFGKNIFESSGIKTVTMPARNATNYGLVFGGFASGAELTLTLTATGEKLLPHNAFLRFNGTNGKPVLKNITLPSDLTGIGSYAFQYCTGLTDISIPVAVTVLGEYCFASSGLLSIDLSATGVTAVPDGAFRDCVSLNGNNLVLKDTTVSIGANAFDGCTAIRGRFDLTDSVESIDSLAFANCANITQLYLSKNLTSMKGDSLYGCNSLVKISMPLLDMTILGITYAQLFAGIGSINQSFEIIFLNGPSTELINGAFMNFDGTNGKPKLTNITLPDDFTKIGYRAFEGCTALGAILIPNDTEIIEYSAFEGCTALQIIDLSGTQVIVIKDSTFKGCSSLNAITLRDDITAIGAGAFENCSALQKFILLGNATTTLPGTVDAIGARAFYGCSALESIDLSPTGVHVISESAFENCILLSDVSLPDGLTEIKDYAFKGCLALLEITVPNNEVSFGIGIFSGGGLEKITMPLTYITYAAMFGGLTSDLEVVFTYNVLNSAVLRENAFLNFNGSSLPRLKKITIPVNIVTIGNSAFQSCSGLVSVSLPASITAIGNLAFSGCSSLTDSGITLPDNLTELGNQVFSGCSSLLIIVIPVAVVKMGSSLFENSGIHTVTMPLRNNVNVQYQNVFNGFAANAPLTLILTQTADTAIPAGSFTGFNGKNDKPQLLSVTTPSNLISIGNNAFQSCQGLTEVNLYAGLETIGVSAFEDCTGLSGIAVPSSVNSIGAAAFRGCTALASVNLSGLTSLNAISDSTFKNCGNLATVSLPASMKYIKDSAFYGCGKLNGITIPANVDEIGAYAFYGCSSLTTIDLSNAGATGLSVIAISAFENCSALYEITLPENTSKISDRAFAGTTSLKSLTVPDTATVFGREIFSGGGLTSIIMPLLDMDYRNIFSGLTTNLTVDLFFVKDTALADDAFAGFNGLNGLPKLINIYLPDGLETIGERALNDCTGLISIVIPETVTTIDDEAFMGCSNLKTITFTGASTLEYLEDRVFSGCLALNTVTIPSGVTYVGANLFEKSGVNNVTMPARNAFGYSSIFNGFDNSTAVKTLTLTLTATAETVLPESAFANFNGTLNTPKLTSIALPNNLTVIGNRAFQNCAGLSAVSLVNTISGIGQYAFAGCTGLSSIDLSGTSITAVAVGTFEGCSGLSSIVFKSGIASIQSSAFKDCVNLTALILPDSVAAVGTYAFAGCKKLTEINFGTGLISLSDNALNGSTNVIKVTMPLQNISFTNLFNGTGGTQRELSVEFTNNLAMTPVTALADNAFLNFNGMLTSPKLISIILPENLTAIGASAFENCSYLINVVIYENLETMGEAAFKGCSILPTINLSATLVIKIESETFMNCMLLSAAALSEDVEYIGDRAFYNCKNLSTITIPSNVDYIGKFAFYSCEKLLSVDISRDNAIGLAVILESAFEGCISLANVKLPSNLEKIEDRAFKNCVALTTLTMPDSLEEFGTEVFYGSGLTHITLPFTDALYSSVFRGVMNNLTVVFTNSGKMASSEKALSDGAFKDFDGTATSNLPNLVSVKLPDYLETVGKSAFENCSGLTIVTIPDTVTLIDNYAFRGCTALHTVTLSDTLMELGAGVFSGCTSAAFTTIIIPNSVKVMGISLFENSGITTVTMPARNASHYQSIFDGFANGRTLTLTLTATGEIVLPDNAFTNFTGTNGRPKLIAVTLASDLTKIGNSAFEGCTGLTGISFPVSLTVLGTDCFKGSGLTSADLGSVKVIPNGAFMNCKSLGLITFNPATASIGNSAFEGCTGIYTSTAGVLRLPDTVLTIGKETFKSCTGLTDINLGTGLTSIVSDALLGSNNLVKVTMPLLACVTSFETLFYGIGGTAKNFEVVFTNGDTVSLIDGAFSGFDGTSNKPKLTAVTLPGDLTAIGNNAFKNCTALGAISIPANVLTIGEYCFNNCSSLAAVDFSGTGVTVIPLGAFMGCTALKTATLNAAGTTAAVGDSAFEDSGLENIYHINNSALKTIGARAFYHSNLQSLDLRNITVQTIKEYTFARCEYLTDIILPGTLTKIDKYAFYLCKSLGSVIARGSINTAAGNNQLPANVASIGESAFQNCEALINITLTATGVTEFSAKLFMNCYDLETVYLPAGLKTIGVSVFENDSKLSFINPDNSVEEIGSNAFKGCSGLPSLTIEVIKSISSDALTGCDNLENVKMIYLTIDYSALFHRQGVDAGEINITFLDSSTDKELYTEIFKNFNGNNGLPKLISIVLPLNLTQIGDRAFENCYYLKSMFIPVTIGSIGSAAFRNCRAIDKIDLSETGVTQIKDDTFSGCIALKDISFNTETTEIGKRAFWDCIALTDIQSSGLTDELTVIGDAAFCGSGLTVLDLRSTGVTLINKDSFKDAQLTEVNLNTATISIGISAFSGNSGLSTVNISSLALLSIIDSYAFNGCTALKALTLPASMRTIGAYAFAGTSLGSGSAVVTLNSGLQSIGNNAFAGTELTSLVIPTSVISLGGNVFAGAMSLVSVELPLIADFDYGPTFTGITQDINIKLIYSTETGATALGDYAFRNFNGETNKPKIINIFLPTQLTGVGAYAFQNCTGITSITSQFTSNLLSIGNYAFAGSGLTSADLTVTGVTVINSYVFSDCAELSSVTLKNNTTAIYDYAFYNCALFSNFSFNALTLLQTIGSGAFRNTGLTSVNLTNTLVTVIAQEAFMGAKLTGITLRLITSSIGANAFANNTGLTSVDFSGFNSLSSIGNYAFSGCTNLNSVTLNTTGLTVIGTGAFASTAILTITIPDTVTTLGDSIFAKCSSLATVYMPLKTAFDYSAVLAGRTKDATINLNLIDTTIQNGAFSGLDYVAGITLPSGLVTIGNDAFREISGGIASIRIPDTVTSIGTGAFADSKTLTEIILPANAAFTIISQDMFSGCAELTYMAIPGTVTIIGAGAFANCVKYSNGGTISLPSSLLTIGDNAFENTAAAGITIPASVTYVGKNIFTGTTTLAAVTMPHSSTFVYADILNGFTTNLTLVFSGGSTSAALPSGAFNGFNGTNNKPKLVSITLPAALTGISDYAFAGCTGLTSIGIPTGVTAIGISSFSGCTGLTSATITLPNGLLTIGNSAFSGCTGLTSVSTIPSSVTGIGSNAFQNCTGLTALTIPYSVLSIGSNAFAGCTMTLNVLRSVSDGITSGNGIGLISPSVIFVNSDSLEAYRTDWLSHESIIKPKNPVISFESNGGSAVTAITRDYGYILQSADKPADPVKTGAAFGGWFTDSGFNNSVNWTTYMVTDSVTFYAKWVSNQYTITFNSNGGGAVASVTADYGTSVPAPGSPAKTGYSFAGWYSDTGLATAVSWNYTLTANVTFHARWDAEIYTVTLNHEDESNTESYIYLKYENGFYLNSGDIVKITTITPPVRAGYSFQGYYSAVDGGTQYITNAGAFTVAFTTTIFTSNTVIYAQWLPIQYTVTWVDGNGLTIYTEQVRYGVTPQYNEGLYGMPMKTATAQYTYTFNGWDTMPAAVTGAATYTAQFIEALRSYTVTWVDGNGVIIYAAPAAYNSTPSYNQATYGAPQKAMDTQYTYIFNGNWNPSIVAVTGAAMYNAQFTAVPRSYTITFESNGGSSVAPVTYIYNTSVAAPAAPEKDGYIFDGWYIDDGTFSNAVSWDYLLTGNITFYAKWIL